MKTSVLSRGGTDCGRNSDTCSFSQPVLLASPGQMLPCLCGTHKCSHLPLHILRTSLDIIGVFLTLDNLLYCQEHPFPLPYLPHTPSRLFPEVGN
jgi:hypothetical protein